jgi:hypothetical protein
MNPYVVQPVQPTQPAAEEAVAWDKLHYLRAMG